MHDAAKAIVRPFLRWAGGKQKLVKELMRFVPPAGMFKIYFEPFVGGGSLFFALQPEFAVLGDVNPELINCYRHVAKQHSRIAAILSCYAIRSDREFYYSIRDQTTYNISPLERAARFIYLNKTAFNGIFRVNRAGRFNVPYGPSNGGPAMPTIQTLARAARCLRQAKLMVGDFEESVAGAKKGDFIYLDPPYPPRSDTAYFTHYSSDRFGWEEQERVACIFRALANRGCLVMLSNADQKRLRRLYADFRITRLEATRWLGSNGNRFRVREIVVTNYDNRYLLSAMKKPRCSSQSERVVFRRTT